MKKKIIFWVIAGALLAGASAFFVVSRIGKTAPENAKSAMIEAQRLLGLLKRTEESQALSEDGGTFIELSAIRRQGRFQYSEGWKRLSLPAIREGLGFNFRCSADGTCLAMEVRGDSETGSGIGCDVSSGDYECYGEFAPVTTQGFDGSEVVVGCKMV